MKLTPRKYKHHFAIRYFSEWMQHPRAFRYLLSCNLLQNLHLYIVNDFKGLNQDEEKLISGCLSHNPAFQKELYKFFAPKMFGVCLRYAMDRDEAADLLQEGFIKVFDNLNDFKKEGSLEGWIRKIMVNTALENYRKKNYLYILNIDDVDLIDEPDDEDDEEDLISKVEINYVIEIIQQLSPGYRMVLNLYAIEGYTHKEIAKHMEISVGTSKSQLARARVILIEKIKASLAKKTSKSI